MIAKRLSVIGHVPGAMNDDPHQEEGTRNGPHQGAKTGDHLLGPVIDDHRTGGVMPGDPRLEEAVKGDHPPRGHRLNTQDQAVQRDWQRNSWKQQVG